MKYRLLTTLLLGLFLICFASAMYAGQNVTVDLGTNENVKWNITGNSEDMIGLSISQVGSQAIVSVDKLFKPDNFTITFYTTKETSSGGGGGSSSSSSSSSSSNESIIVPFDEAAQDLVVLGEIDQEDFNTENNSANDDEYDIENGSHFWFYTIIFITGIIIFILSIKLIYSKEDKDLLE